MRPMAEINIIPGIPGHQSYQRAIRVVFQTADGRRGTVMYTSPLIADWRCHLEKQCGCRVTILSTARVEIGIDRADPAKESIRG